MSKLQKTNPINYILKAITESLEKIYDAAKVYVQEIDRDPDFREKLIKEAAEKDMNFVNIRMCNQLERVGRGEMHWQLLLNGNAGHGAQIRRLPFSEQRAIFEEHRRYPLLLPGGDNVLIDVTQLSRDQANQIFGDGYIRDLAEQKTYMADNAIEKQVTEAQEDYEILSGSRVRIRDIIFSRKQIQHILLQM